jgi:hypothetical protein
VTAVGVKGDVPKVFFIHAAAVASERGPGASLYRQFNGMVQHTSFSWDPTRLDLAGGKNNVLGSEGCADGVTGVTFRAQ